MAKPYRIRAREDEVRAKIKTTQLVNRLQDNVLGQVLLTDGQRKSIEILLKKSLPDLSSVELSGNSDKPVSLTLKWAK